ncbi:hypothetical protein JCM10450v2_003334 [Rhodotorula kratochvilovae]
MECSLWLCDRIVVLHLFIDKLLYLPEPIGFLVDVVLRLAALLDIVFIARAQRGLATFLSNLPAPSPQDLPIVVVRTLYSASAAVQAAAITTRGTRDALSTFIEDHNLQDALPPLALWLEGLVGRQLQRHYRIAKGVFSVELAFLYLRYGLRAVPRLTAARILRQISRQDEPPSERARSISLPPADIIEQWAVEIHDLAVEFVTQALPHLADPCKLEKVYVDTAKADFDLVKTEERLYNAILDAVLLRDEVKREKVYGRGGA